MVVHVKIIEFQATKGVETGLSAYFKKLPRTGPFGSVSTSGNAINSADLTFPSSTAAGLSVFLDRISMNSGDIEVVIQALADDNKATILFRPRAMVMVGPNLPPSLITTSQMIPYETTQVVGNTAVQTVDFKPTGVILNLSAPEVIDDDGDWNTTHDTYIRLNIDATVTEQGQRIIVALDDKLIAGGVFTIAANAISVPEFVTRKIKTEVWVPEGETLMLGGLYSNSESKTLTSVPYLKQGENFAAGALDKVIPGNSLAIPLSATIGNQKTTETRRELVFLIRAEVWRPSFSLGSDLGFDDGDLFDISEEAPDAESENIVDNIDVAPPKDDSE
ncbi:MAG: hypothetical protein VCD00_00180 [Candidatus Hydrogenedentota bacterium]